MSAVTRQRRAMSPGLVLAAILSALLLFTVMSVTAPGRALAATTLATACDGVALRTSTNTTAARAARLPNATKVSVVATVTGGSWLASCTGAAQSGTRWYRISAVNGRTVKALYGVTYVYAATGLFKDLASTVATSARTLTSACDGIILRTSPRTTAAREGRISSGAKITIATSVTGSTWRATCTGIAVSGSRWYRISAVNGRSARSLYGVTYVYAATGLFKAIAPRVVTPAPAPTPAPPAPAAPAPTPAPTPPPAVQPPAPTTPVNPVAPPLATLFAACDSVNLRSSASTSGSVKTALSSGAMVTVAATGTGGSWSAECAGQVVSGSDWHQITAINGVSVASLYGIDSVYGAVGLFATTVPIPAPIPPPAPDPAPVAPMTEGIDVSHWQNTIDWMQVALSGKQFAFIKASESTNFVDWMYTTNRTGAQAAGLLVGAYHFARPDATPGDAIAEADHFINTALPERGNLLPVLDLEVTGPLAPTDLQGWTAAFLGRVYERTGVRALIYVSPAFWVNNMGNTDWFAANGYQVLWIAHWTAGPKPIIPASDWGALGWTFWQYTSSGSVPGIAGRVDLNRYNGTDFSKVLIP